MLVKVPCAKVHSIIWSTAKVFVKLMCDYIKKYSDFRSNRPTTTMISDQSISRCIFHWSYEGFWSGWSLHASRLTLLCKSDLQSRKQRYHIRIHRSSREAFLKVQLLVHFFPPQFLWTASPQFALMAQFYADDIVIYTSKSHVLQVALLFKSPESIKSRSKGHMRVITHPDNSALI